jgi:hypothetical protein
LDEYLDRSAFAASDIDDAHVREIDGHQARQRVRFVALKRLRRSANHPQATRRTDDTRGGPDRMRRGERFWTVATDWETMEGAAIVGP